MAKAAKRERQKENRERARVERERMLKRQRQMRTLRSLAFVLVPVLVILVIITLVSGNDSKKKAQSYQATIETSRGNIVVDLDSENAPKSTQHFVKLAQDGFYDNTCIDRIARDFVIQGGSKNCDGNPGSGNTIVGELPTNHYPVGSLAAAKTGTDPKGTFDSIFFIVTGSQGATLPNDYTRFGNVVSGQDVADQIAKLPIENNANDGKPTDKIAIKKVTIKTTSGSGSTTTSSTTAAKK